ncbi:MAG: DUF433 domain-containing protein [Maioricimonas sp. JB049]
MFDGVECPAWRGQKRSWQDRININDRILAGKPVIRGTRIAVALILELLAEGRKYDQILQNDPQLAEADILAALSYVAARLKPEEIYPLPIL